MVDYGDTVTSLLTDGAVFSLDKPKQAAAAEIVQTPKDTLSSKTTPSAVVQSPDVQKESSHTTEASYQEMSATGAEKELTLPPDLTQGQPDTQPDINT